MAVTRIVAEARTNVPKSSIKKDFLNKFTDFLSTKYTTDQQNIVAEVQADVMMIRAGAKAPMMNMNVYHNSDSITQETKVTHAGDIAKFISDTLAVPTDRENLIRRDYCAKALEYGEKKVTINERPRKIVVFLNPAASRGGASKMFEKNAAPILHLAGLEVDIIKTEYDGHVKELLFGLDRSQVDGIVVAGGDGTLLETITGIMRKEDVNFRLSVPIGVVPLGETNRFAELLFGSDLGQVKLMAESALAVVKGLGRRVDVLSIKADDGRNTYALCGLHTGAYKDAEVRKSKYWYFGPLKHRWTYLRSAMKQWPPAIQAKISYVLATEENTSLKEHKPPPLPPPPKRSLFSFFYKPKAPPQPKVELQDDDYVDDQEEEISRDISTLEFSAMATSLQDQSQKIKATEVVIGPSELTRTEFIEEGLQRNKHKSHRFVSTANESMIVKKIKFVPEIPEGRLLWYYIDGEAFEAMPVEIELLRKRVKIFCHEPEFKVT